MSKRSQSASASVGASARKRIRVMSESDDELPGSVVSAGKLLHIKLKNFMCHGNFEMSFNPRMNFVLGHNGSGKSGILTAIIIGLGGSAKATNRSNSIGQLVKKGEPTATIEIHISNGGPEPFEFETFGSRIVVVRTIRERGGGGGYKIMNEKGVVVSQAKKKLDVILRYFEISVNNPITILTQDCARTFLRDSDSKARFKLFKQGSGLAVIEEELQSSVELQRGIEMQLKRRKEKCKYFQGEYKERMRIYEMLDTAERAKERVVKLEHELKWVQIQNEEHELEDLNKELQKRVDTLDKATKEVESYGTKQQTMLQLIDSLSTEVAKVEAGRSTHSLQIASKKQAMQEKRNEFFSARKKFMGIDAKVKQLHADIKVIENNMLEITDQGERDQYEREVVELQNQVKAAEEATAEKTNRLRSVQEKVSELDRKRDTLDQQKKALSRTVANCREQMNAIRNETDNLAVYGSHIPQFVKALEKNQNRFSQPPLGPIGRYLEVPDDRYKAVVEKLVSSQLSSFIVNTLKDQEEFQRIFAKECPHQRCPAVIQRTFKSQPYDTRRHGCEVPRTATSPMQQMNCKSVVVMNTIIDMVRIESVLICDTMKEGRQLTENLENVPRNLKRVIVMDPLCEVYPAPNFRIYSGTPKPANFIQVSAADKKSQLKTRFEEHNKQLEQVRAMSKYTDETADQLKQDRKRLLGELQQLERTKRDLATRIADITDQHLGPRVEEETLLEEKVRLVASLEQLSVEHAPQKATRDRLTAELDEMAEDLRRTEQQAGEYDSKLEEARGKVTELRDKRDRLVLARSDKANMLQDMEQRVNSQRNTLTGQQTKVNDLITAVGGEGERIRTRKTVEEVRDQICTLNAQREVSTHIKESREEIMAELQGLEEKIGELNTEVELGLQTLDVQHRATLKHKAEYEDRKRVVQNRMSVRFRELLAQQSYHGDLKVDYTKSTLDLEINPRDGGTVQGTKSLSGGERSFSTVAFLLSIWSCIEHPFFLLDEYDVFTDGSNRELMTRMLIKEAMAKPHNQYMFLTPQDVSHLIKPTAELEVFKMPDKK